MDRSAKMSEIYISCLYVCILKITRANFVISITLQGSFFRVFTKLVWIGTNDQSSSIVFCCVNLKLYTLIAYSHCIISNCTLSLYTLIVYSQIVHSHCTLSLYTLIVYSHCTLSLYTPIVHSHCILSLYTLKLYTLIVYSQMVCSQIVYSHCIQHGFGKQVSNPIIND